MEALKHEQIKDLQEHQAIRHGGWKFLSIMTSIAVEVGAMILVAYIGWQERGSGFNSLFWALLFFVLAVPVWSSIRGRRKWLLNYWHKNVRGYVARFVHLDIVGDDNSRKLHCVIRTRREDADDQWQTHRMRVAGEHDIAIAISLPLGGWFTQSWIRSMDRDQIGRLQDWSVRLRAIFDTGAVMVEVRHQNHFWNVSERIVMDIGNALRFLEEIAVHPHIESSVSGFFSHRTIQLDDTARERKKLLQSHGIVVGERDKARGELAAMQAAGEQLRVLGDALTETRREIEVAARTLETASRELADEHRRYTEAVGFVSEINDQFKASARLRDKIQALHIHEAIILWLSTLHGQTGTQHEADVIALAEIRRRIQKQAHRDRTRHDRTKPAASPTTGTP